MPRHFVESGLGKYACELQILRDKNLSNQAIPNIAVIVKSLSSLEEAVMDIFSYASIIAVLLALNYFLFD